MPEIEISYSGNATEDFSFYCGTCGKGLCDFVQIDNNRKIITIDVCPNCIKKLEKEYEMLEEKYEMLKEKK